jgi:hypothetical protein
VTASLDIYPVEREGNTLSYDRMTLTRVERLTPECEKAWAKARATAVSAPASTLRFGGPAGPPGVRDYSTSSITHTLTLPVAGKGRAAFAVGFDNLFPVAEKIPPAFIAIVFAQRQRFFSLIAIGHHHHAARILVGAATAEGNAVGMIEPQRLHAMGKTLTGVDQFMQLFDNGHLNGVGLSVAAGIFIGAPKRSA